MILAILIVAIGCNSSTNDTKKEPAAPPKAVAPTPATPNLVTDSMLMQVSHSILPLLKNRDYKALAGFVHPEGVRFSPYAFIDTSGEKLLTPAALTTIKPKHEQWVWGTMDGSGEDIKMNIDQYFKRFVYDADYLQAKRKAVNTFLGHGNSLNNLLEIYPGASFTEFYFPGFDPKFEGMDWKTLRLVFKTESNRPLLIAIVHDEWTI